MGKKRSGTSDKDRRDFAEGYIVKLSRTAEPVSKAMSAQARRAFIAEALLVFQLTQVEIQTALEEAGLVNPKSGEPWSLGTINRDVKIMREQWALEARSAHNEFMESQLARIRNAQRLSWSRGDLDAYARFMEQEIKITGTGQRDLQNLHEDPVGDGWDLMTVLDATVERIEERNRLLGDGPVIDGEAT